MTTIFLETKNLYLRPLTHSDAEGAYPRWFNDQEVCRYNSHGRFPYAIEAALEYIQKVNSSKTDLVLAIVHKKDQVHIGNLSLQKIDFINRNAELAIIVGEKDYWGKGLAKEACLAIIVHGFKTFRLERIYCATPKENIAMRKLAESSGMIKEGVRRKAFFNNGKFSDVIEYGLLADEFVS